MSHKYRLRGQRRRQRRSGRRIHQVSRAQIRWALRMGAHWYRHLTTKDTP